MEKITLFRQNDPNAPCCCHACIAPDRDPVIQALLVEASHSMNRAFYRMAVQINQAAKQTADHDLRQVHGKLQIKLGELDEDIFFARAMNHLEILRLHRLLN